MQRWVLHSVFAVLLISAGVIAGQGVHSVLAMNGRPGLPIEHERTPFAPDREDIDVPPSPAEPRDLDAAASLDAAIPLDENGNARTVSFVTAENDLSHSSDTGTQTKVPGDSVMALILEMFPDADHEMAKIWADEYSEMDLGEVAFVLEQKRRLSGSLDAGLPPELRFKFPSAELTAPIRNAESLDDAIRTISHNLSGSWSVGFRRKVVLPEVSDESNHGAVGGLEDFRSVSFYNFDSGKRISSPLSLHVALPNDEGALLFRLEGNQLTRRGDFQILPDRRVGLSTQAAEIALLDSPILPLDAQNALISDNGEIQYTDSTNTVVIAGRVTVARVLDLSRLSSRDGVIFSASQPESFQNVEPGRIGLAVKTLELSNVDHESERALLVYLQSLQPYLRTAESR